jgi:hypothetical protein
MTKKVRTRLIKEGNYLAEVEVELLYDIDAWSPHISLEDVEKLDRVRLALRERNLEEAAKYSLIYDVVQKDVAGHA